MGLTENLSTRRHPTSPDGVDATRPLKLPSTTVFYKMSTNGFFPFLYNVYFNLNKN